MELHFIIIQQCKWREKGCKQTCLISKESTWTKQILRQRLVFILAFCEHVFPLEFIYPSGLTVPSFYILVELAKLTFIFLLMLSGACYYFSLKLNF